MRARQKKLVPSLVLVAAVVLSALLTPAPSSSQADGPTPNCPNGTAWDNRIQRCV